MLYLKHDVIVTLGCQDSRWEGKMHKDSAVLEAPYCNCHKYMHVQTAFYGVYPRLY